MTCLREHVLESYGIQKSRAKKVSLDYICLTHQHIKVIVETIGVDVIPWAETIDQEKRTELCEHPEFLGEDGGRGCIKEI